MKTIEPIIYSTVQQKVLKFLLKNPGEQFFSSQLTRLAGLTRSATNLALHDLVETGLVEYETKGRMKFYSVSLDSPLVKETKYLLNLVFLNGIVNKLKPLCSKIILFGSAARGENKKDSDFDLLLITNDKSKVNAILSKCEIREELQPVIVTQNEYAVMKARNEVFYKEIQMGRVLWERK